MYLIEKLLSHCIMMQANKNNTFTSEC